MENDSIRASGANTLVDIWIDSKLRSISVSRGAIETYLEAAPDRAEAMTEGDRCEFVRTHLSLVVKAAKNKLRDHPSADSISIDAGQLGGSAAARGGDRRTSERRKGERRKAQSITPFPGDRRKGERRKTDRRGPSRDKKS